MESSDTPWGDSYVNGLIALTMLLSLVPIGGGALLVSAAGAGAEVDALIFLASEAGAIVGTGRTFVHRRLQSVARRLDCLARFMMTTLDFSRR